MKYFFIFALFLIACSDVNERCPTFEVTISDALPIQFWLADCETYNEKEVCGVHHKCWCQPWNCDDDIPFQFRDTPNKDYVLIFEKSNGEIQIASDFDELPISLTESLYTCSYLPNSSPGSCGDKVSFKIAIQKPTDPFVNTSFDDGLSGWFQESTGDTWEVTAPGQIQAINTSKSLYQTADFQNSTYNLKVTGSFTSVSFGTINLIYILKDSLGATITTGTIKTSATIGSWTENIPFSGSGVHYVGIRATGSFLGQTNIFEFSVSTDDVQYNVFAKSDCIDIQNDHSCTTLTEYSNNRNIYGLVYEDVSPVQSFKIRVPAIFFHERFPEEDNVIELSESIVHTSGQVKAQRLFETDYMPYYMHRKMQLILKHQNILIDNQYWTKEEPYEVQDGERRWPAKKAKCFLTEKNYVQRAVL